MALSVSVTPVYLRSASEDSLGSYSVPEGASLHGMEKQSEASLFPAALGFFFFFLYKNRTPSKCPSSQTSPFAFSQNNACYGMQ